MTASTGVTINGKSISKDRAAKIGNTIYDKLGEVGNIHVMVSIDGSGVGDSANATRIYVKVTVEGLGMSESTYSLGPQSRDQEVIKNAVADARYTLLEIVVRRQMGDTHLRHVLESA